MCLVFKKSGVKLERLPILCGTKNWQTLPLLCVFVTNYRWKFYICHLLANVPSRPKTGKRTPPESWTISCSISIFKRHFSHNHHSLLEHFWKIYLSFLQALQVCVLVCTFSCNWFLFDKFQLVMVCSCFPLQPPLMVSHFMHAKFIVVRFLL